MKSPASLLEDPELHLVDSILSRSRLSHSQLARTGLSRLGWSNSPPQLRRCVWTIGGTGSAHSSHGSGGLSWRLGMCR